MNITKKKTLTLNTTKLNNGNFMPRLGIGVYQLKGTEAEKAVTYALQAGYRHIDTASLYENEKEVGNAIRRSGIPRHEIFVTTKIFPSNFLWAESAFNSSLEKLGLGYIDQYLIHWPAPGKNLVWKVLEKMYEHGLVNSIGVSNYSIADLDELLEVSRIDPAVNQIELHPFMNQSKLVEYCQSRNVAVVAYSPLNRGQRLDDPIINDIAEKYEKTPAQIMLRWSLQHDAIVIPKSCRKDRIIENSQIFNFELDDYDMRVLDGLTIAVGNY